MLRAAAKSSRARQISPSSNLQAPLSYSKSGPAHMPYGDASISRIPRSRSFTDLLNILLDIYANTPWHILEPAKKSFFSNSSYSQSNCIRHILTKARQASAFQATPFNLSISSFEYLNSFQAHLILPVFKSASKSKTLA